jgi:hypothetical protein
LAKSAIEVEDRNVLDPNDRVILDAVQRLLDGGEAVPVKGNVVQNPTPWQDRGEP